MNQFLTEDANLNDIKEVLKLEETCFEFDRISGKQLRYLIKSPNSRVVVIKSNNLIIACAIILFRKNSHIARLYSIAVNPQFQSSGISQSLILFIEHNARELKRSEIRLEVRKNNQRAIAFYRKNGYDFFGEYKNFYIDGEDAFRMRKQLAWNQIGFNLS